METLPGRTQSAGTLAIVLAFTILGHGCQPGISRRTVEQAMSGRAGANTARDRVSRAGEKAIPLIFDVVRDSTDELVPQRALLLIMGMVSLHTADPSAPYIRKILANQQEPERIRVLAADMLSEYSESPEPLRALIEHARRDPLEAVRVQCIASLGGLALSQVAGSKSVDRDVQQLFTASIQDKSTKVREQTCGAAIVVAREALYEGIELAWCRQILIQGKHDKEYVVRKAALDGLFILESIRRKQGKR